MSFDSSHSYFAGTSIARKRLEKRRKRAIEAKKNEKRYFWKEQNLSPHLTVTNIKKKKRKHTPKKEYYTKSHVIVDKIGSTIKERPNTSYKTPKYQKTVRHGEFKLRVGDAYNKQIAQDKRKKNIQAKRAKRKKTLQRLNPLRATIPRFDYNVRRVKTPGYKINSEKRFKYKKQMVRPKLKNGQIDHPFYHYYHNISPMAPKFKEKHQRITVAKHAVDDKKSKYKYYAY